MTLANLRVDPVLELRDFAVEWIDHEGLVLSRGNRLFTTRAPDAPYADLAKFPVQPMRALLSMPRLGRRLLRQFFYNVVRLGPGRFFVTFGKQVALIDQGAVRPVEGLLRPTRVLRGGCAVDAHGGVYFGEYLRNTARGPMHLYHLPANTSHAEVVHEFTAGQIRHIHGVYIERTTDSLWVLTGDRGNECRIMASGDGGRSFTAIGAGDETWRAVSVVFRGDYAYYGMDAEFVPNRVFRLELRSGTRRDLGAIDGPVYYSRRCGDDIYLGVTAEGCRSQPVNQASLWRVDADDGLEHIASFAKDGYPSAFMPGTLNFPLGCEASGPLYVSGVALDGLDGRTVRVQRNAAIMTREEAST